MSSIRKDLADAVTLIRNALENESDPIERAAAADAVRADLAVLLTHVVRRSAYQAHANHRIPEMAQSGWRSQKYLYQLARQHRDSHGLAPVSRIKDINSRHVLDLNDLARLRGQSR